MDFLVLARKLRPARFEHLIGQDTVVRALRNAILTDRVAHAFLFTGSRGVGKTSTARILTKALNCEQPADGEPCNECGNCREITLNTSPDVFEIDAASNRGIDNIRELRENTKYAPVKSRFKTYIIDEVHMLTLESFNALLKTLEEPPPHVKFILATTNPHRIPETIVSRCQRYDFARVPVPVLAGYLGEVTAREGIRLSQRALEAIARNAAGGVRDALTAVDQVVAYAGQEADDVQVLSILGLTDNREVFTLLGAILDKSVPAALEAFAAIRERGHDLGVLLEALIREVKDFSLYLSLEGRSLEGRSTTFANHPPETLAFFAERGAADKGVTADELQQLFYLLLEVEGQIKRSEFAQACFEMGLVKACRVQPLVGVSELLAQVRSLTQERGLSQGEARPETPQRGAQPGSTARSTAAPPPEIARIAARGQARARESAGGAARNPSAPRAGDRSAGDESDEGEPGRGPDASPPLAPATPQAPQASATPPAPQATPAPAAQAARTASAAAVVSAAPAPSPSSSVPAAPSPTASPPTVPSPRAPAPLAPTPPPADADGPTGDMTEADARVPTGEGAALCDDPRWRSCVEALAGKHPRLAAKLRRAELSALAADAATLLPADAANRPTADELETAAPFLAGQFGPAFRLHLIDDTTKTAREAHTIAGRNRIVQAQHVAARRGAAEQDEQVQRLLRAFPQGRIVEIALGEEPHEDGHSNRSDDG